MRLFEAIVIILAIFFALSVLIAVGIPYGRYMRQRPMVRLPPPKDHDGWSRCFATPISIKGGPTLRSLSDVRAYLLDMPARQRESAQWQRVQQLLLAAVERGDIQQLDDAIITASLHSGKLTMR